MHQCDFFGAVAGLMEGGFHILQAALFNDPAGLPVPPEMANLDEIQLFLVKEVVDHRYLPSPLPPYKSKQLNVSELARVCHISRTTAYKYIGLLEA